MMSVNDTHRMLPTGSAAADRAAAYFRFSRLSHTLRCARVRSSRRVGIEIRSMSSAKSPTRQKPASARGHSQSDVARTGQESGGPAAASSGATQSAAPESELDPVTASEVRTKLDLARTFLDMGDPESARHMLDEVLKEGNSVQKQEAQRLIASMP
jgi:FimV-like protein